MKKSCKKIYKLYGDSVYLVTTYNMFFESIVFYVLVIDCLGYNAVAWFGHQWYTKHFSIFARWFPVVKGWGIYYLLLVLWIGSLLYRAGMLG